MPNPIEIAELAAKAVSVAEETAAALRKEGGLLPDVKALAAMARAGFGKITGDADDIRRRMLIHDMGDAVGHAVGDLEPALKPESMDPPAFRILNAQGRSPDFPSTEWSLPEFKDGVWKPGAWRHGFATEDNFPGTDNYWVGNNLHWYNSRRGSRLFEAQIGDEPSRSLWKAAASHRWNFPAKSIRLLREFTTNEIDFLKKELK